MGLFSLFPTVGISKYKFCCFKDLLLFLLDTRPDEQMWIKSSDKCVEIFYIRAKLNPILNWGYTYSIISIEFFSFVLQECNCSVKRNLSSSPTKTEIQPNFKSSLFIAQICTFLQMSWQNTVWSITGKELFLKKHIDGRKILGKSGLRLFQLMDYDLERKCVFFFFSPPEWENNETFNTLNDSSVHEWTTKRKLKKKKRCLKVFLSWILKLLI